MVVTGEYDELKLAVLSSPHVKQATTACSDPRGSANGLGASVMGLLASND